MEYIGIIAAVLAVEILLRRAVRRKLKEGEGRELSGWPIRLQRYHNYGMAEDRLEKKPLLVKIIGVAAVSVVVGIFLMILPLKGKRGLKIALSLILGGGLANLIERFLNGYVTDYFQIKVPLPRIRNLVFNVADFCIFIGAALMVISECCRIEK